MKKAATLIVIVTLTVLSLVILQVSWLQKAISLGEDEFNKTVDKIVLPLFAFEYIRNASILDATPEEISEAIERTKLGKEVKLPMKGLEERLRVTQHILDSLFRSHDIDTPIVFGVYKYGTEEFSMLSDSLYQDELINSAYADCFNCAVSVDMPSRDDSTGNIEWLERLDARRSVETLLEDPNFDNATLEMIAVHFPDRSPVILGQISNQLILTIALILVLVGCFTYTIVIIRNQKRLSEIKKDFVNNLTHELKTPIASILLSTKVLGKSKTASLGEEDKRFITLIHNEGKRLENQVDRVLQIAMIDSGNFSLDMGSVDLHTVIDSVISSLQVIIEQRKAEISITLGAETSLVKGDDTHLFNLFYNLIENALKYSDQAPEIKVVTQNKNGTVEISIQDNGIGMAKDIQENIFDRFYRGQSKDNYKEKGFGLGLSYVKSIVDEHNGDISLSSEPNQGTTFSVTFDTITNE